MSGVGLNHRILGDQLSTALITGGTVEAVCGHIFTPHLRVGSSGAADNPRLDICQVCERVMELFEEQNELAFQHRRVKAEIKALQEGVRTKALQEATRIAVTA